MLRESARVKLVVTEDDTVCHYKKMRLVLKLGLLILKDIITVDDFNLF